MTRELVEAAKAVCDDAQRDTKGAVTVFGEPQSVIDAHLVATLRAAVRAAEAAPVADTVAVPVDVLRSLRLRLRDFVDDYGNPTRICATCHGLKNHTPSCPIPAIDAILPPPPAPEPSAELVAEWKREAKEYADKCCAEHESVTHDEYVGIQTGYVARARAEWVRTQKGGG